MTTTLDNISAPDSLDLSGLAPLHPLLPHVVMYTRPQCSTCDRLKILFKAAKLPVVAVPLDVDDAAHQLFNGELRVKQTPIVLVHNTFQGSAYFSGFNSDQARIAINAVFSRLKILEASTELTSVDSYLSDLATNIEPGQSHPFIRPDVFTSLAARHLGHTDVQAPRCTAPELLSTSTRLLSTSASETPYPLR